MKSSQIRKLFINFFKNNSHTIVESASLIPFNDKTLLFTNAGMVPFKDVFIGSSKKKYTKAVSIQKCLRAGGKHNDLENVGYTARHHTFFEMMGNFSFGDYFKKDAIKLGWDFLTNILKISKDKLYITVYHTDNESYDIWHKDIGLDIDRIIKIDTNDNFWSMGDNGPCGPCTEIFYDHGENVDGGLPGTPEEDGDRYIEIWNIVFMQYNRQADGTLENLAKPSVDTGMGLERITAVMQGVVSNYDTDVFQALIKKIASVINTQDIDNYSLKVIADHIRACSFLIADGVFPSNEGQGYVLRRIVRRAVRHGYKLGATDSFLYKLLDELIAQMGESYPELVSKKEQIGQALKKEEELFAETLIRGLKIFEQNLDKVKNKTIDGNFAFKLYDTYGFPLDLVEDMAREKELSIDVDGFNKAMAEQKQLSKQSKSFAVDYNNKIKTDFITNFVGYNQTNINTQILEIYTSNLEKVKNINERKEYFVILKDTPFYAESGGQVADKGFIKYRDAELEVLDVQKSGKAFIHRVKLIKGCFVILQDVKAYLDLEYRQAISRAHSATHLLHSALKKVVSKTADQKGSLVNADSFRFDYSHDQALNSNEIKELERLVNKTIRNNFMTTCEEMSKDDAINKGAMAIFGEKYEDRVRVVAMDDFSIELCGGIHTQRTGDIGLFKILSESGVASGVRRIEAVVASKAEDNINKTSDLLTNVDNILKSNNDNVVVKILRLNEKLKAQEKEIKKLKKDLITGENNSIKEEQIKDVLVVSAFIPSVDIGVLRDKIDDYKSKYSKVIVALSTEVKGKLQIVVGVSKSLTPTLQAGNLVNFIATQVGGKGGGRPDMAQAGGSDVANIEKAMQSLYSEVTPLI